MKLMKNSRRLENFENGIVGKIFSKNSLEDRYFSAMLQRNFNGNIQPRNTMLTRRVIIAKNETLSLESQPEKMKLNNRNIIKEHIREKLKVCTYLNLDIISFFTTTYINVKESQLNKDNYPKTHD